MDLFRWVSDNLGLVIAVAVLVLLVLLALSALSQGALVEGVAALDRGEPRRFSSTLRAGASYFLPVLGLNVVFFLIALGLLLVIALPIYLLVVGTFAATESVGVRVLVVVLVVLVGIALLILVFVPLGILYQLALRELVLGGERVFGSIRSGFGLFRRTLGRSLLLGIIQFGLGLVVGVLLLIAQAVAGLGVAVALILAAPFLVVFGAVGTFFSSLLDARLPPAHHPSRRSRPAARPGSVTSRESIVSSRPKVVIYKPADKSPERKEPERGEARR